MKDMIHISMENVFRCTICNKDASIIEVKHHTDYEERILSCGHRPEKHIRNITEPPIHLSDKIAATVSRFKQSQKVWVEEKVINGKLSIQFSAEKINLTINNSIIKVTAQDDYTFTRSVSHKEDIINKIRSLRYEVERNFDNEEKEKTLSLIQRVNYILVSTSYSDANSKFSKIKRLIIHNKWFFTIATSPFIIKIIDLIQDMLKNSQPRYN
jgi:hypothetical protein